MARKKHRKKCKGHYQRGEYTSTKTSQVCHYRSGWEQKVMTFLDASQDVELWTYEQTIIEYVSNIRSKRIRKYYPDFYVKYRDGHAEIIEVKPKRKLLQATVKKKAEAAKLWCEERGMTYRMLTEIDLKALGLI